MAPGAIIKRTGPKFCTESWWKCWIWSHMRPKSAKKVSNFWQSFCGFLACCVPWPQCLPKLLMLCTKMPEADFFGSHIFVTQLLRSCDEVAHDSHEVAEKFSWNDPLRIPCASTASPHPSIKESTKGGLVRHRESLRGHFMRTFQQLRRNLVQLRRNLVATSSYGAVIRWCHDRVVPR